VIKEKRWTLDSFINKIISDQPVDEMVDEEMELTQLKEKSEQSHIKYIRQTGHTSKKGSINIKAQQHRESFKNR
jgi:hypothetical protein